MYYNTTHKVNTTKEKKIASRQDTEVYLAAKDLADRNKTLTPRRVWWAYGKTYGSIQLTSLRRSINTLIGMGYMQYVMNKGKYAYLLHDCPVEGFETRERIIKVS